VWDGVVGVSCRDNGASVSDPDGPIRWAGSGSKRRRFSADTAAGFGFLPVVVEPCGDLGRDEPDAAADLVERDSPFGDEAADVAFGDVQPGGRSGMPRQVSVGRTGGRKIRGRGWRGGRKKSGWRESGWAEERRERELVDQYLPVLSVVTKGV
jgi:hypothetical protein